MSMKRLVIAAVALTAGTLMAASQGFAQTNSQPGQGRAIVTVLPNAKTGNVGQISAQNLKVKINGKYSTVSSFNQIQESNCPVELVLTIDAGARTSVGAMFNDMHCFV